MRLLQSLLRFNRFITCFFFIALLTSCKTTAPVMSVEDARKIVVEFKQTEVNSIPRTIDSLKKEFKEGGPVPQSCVADQNERKERLELLYARLVKGTGLNQGLTKSISVTAEDLIVSGKFSVALNHLTKATNLSKSVNNKARLHSQRARIYAQIGNIDSAISAMRRFSPDPKWLKGSIGQLYYNAGEASIAHAQGDLPLAEYHYRKAIYNASFTSESSGYINIHALRTGLAMTLLQQNRIIEAEAEARLAVKKLGVGLRALRAQKKVYETSYYSGKNAGPVAILAAVFLEQERLEEAEYLARIAVNMHEVGCSDPESLGLNRARAIYISVLAQQEKWSRVLEQAAIAKAALVNHPQLFELQIGTSLDFAEASLYEGDVSKGREILNKKLQKLAIETDSQSAQKSLIQGVLALDFADKGKNKEALKLFSQAFPILIQTSVTSELGGTSSTQLARKQRIFSGYMITLQDLLDKGVQEVTGIQIKTELLRIVSASRSDRVQKAFSASHIRASSGDPELSKIVRQQQDITEEISSVTETLANIRYSPEFANSNLSDDFFKKRLINLRLASNALKAEILNRYPKFADFTNPRPMTASEMSQSLRPDQALVVYHVMKDRSYVWALRKGKEIDFSVIDLGFEELKNKITILREAVDPQNVQRIEDIPEYDVKTAYELYEKLLTPVKKSWQGAEELLVVPDGPLGALPFSLLATTGTLPSHLGSDQGADQDSEDILFQDYAQVDWLAYKLAVVQLPSIDTLKILNPHQSTQINTVSSEETQDTRRPFAGFGDPYFNLAQFEAGETLDVTTRGINLLRSVPDTRSVDVADLSILPRLADTRDEIETIGRVLGADFKRDLFFGKQANEQVVKNTDLSRYKVISFATHGLIPGDLNGLEQPALAMTNPEIAGVEGDGLLTLNEILSLKLQADFIVLSACNTAASDGQGAEAVSGLGRAFFYAGARSLLVSNWPVHSAATTSLMSILFTDLAANPLMTRAEGMRRARVKMIREEGYRFEGKLAFSYAHPIFWAPFTVIGDGGV